MYQHEQHKGEFDKVLVFGAQSCAGYAMTFHVMTDYGIVRSRVPIHMLCWKPEAPLMPLDHLQLWDCFHENVSTVEYDALFDCRAKVVLKDKTEHWGDYKMTFDWYRNAYSQEPSQYKCLHMIALDNGNYTLQPNNRIFWKNKGYYSWIHAINQAGLQAQQNGRDMLNEAKGRPAKPDTVQRDSEAEAQINDQIRAYGDERTNVKRRTTQLTNFGKPANLEPIGDANDEADQHDEVGKY